MRRALLLGLLGALALPLARAVAVPVLTITPITWNVIGLDSNDVTDGPELFPVGARVCNVGPDAATNVVSNFIWDSANSFVNLDGASMLTLPSLDPGACTDFYYNVLVTRNAAAYDTNRRYHITASADGIGTVSTPTPRELYVEKLISQNRNSVTSISGPTTVFVGQTYQYTVVSSTATGGYEQLESFLDFPNIVFRLVSVSATYTSPTGGTNDKVYADACGWNNNPSSPTYRSCIGPENYTGGKAGGDITTTYTVEILSAGTATLTTLIYDFSGSSFHYNGDFGLGVNSITVTALDSADLSLSKSHSGSFRVGENGTYNLTVTNAGPTAAAGPITVTDTLPSGLSFVSGTGTGWSCSAVGQTVTCSHAGPLAMGSSLPTLTLTVAVGSGASSPVTNTASVSSPTGDSSPGNNTVSDPTTVIRESDLSLTKTDSPDPVVSGGALGYLLTVTNNGPSPSTSVALTDTLPSGVSLVSVTPSQGSCSGSAPIACSLGSIASGASATVAVNVTVTAGAGAITNSASVAGAENDPDTTNNSALAITTVSPAPVNQPPVAADDSDSTAEDTPVAIVVLVNDNDPDGSLDPASVTVTANPSNGTATPNPATGIVTYTPNADFSGTDTFTYQVCDDGTPALCDTALVTVTVTPVNDPPVANDDSATTPQDTPVTVTVLTNDSDSDGTLDPASANETVAPGNGTTSVNPLTGEITYTPNSGFSGTDTFTYEVCDDGSPALCDTAIVTVTVSPPPPPNQPPVADDDSDSTPEDTPVDITVLANDNDPDGSLDPASVTVTATPSNGTATPNPATGIVTYTPNAGFSGTDTFTYQVCDDGSPVLCDTALVTVTVTPVNDPPVANDDSDTTPQDTPVTVPVISNDSDPDGTLDPSSVNVTVAPANGTTSVNPTTGEITYTPNSGFSGSDTFTYQVCDDGTPALCDTAVVDITISPAPPNQPPVANNDSVSTSSGTPATVTVISNDADPDADPLTITTFTQGTNGTVTCSGNTCTYTPAGSFSGTDTFTYTICDPSQACDTATVTVVVAAVQQENRPPVATDDSAATGKETPVTVAVVANDSDPDGDTLTITGFTQGVNGAVSCSGGSCTYTPAAGFSGADTFSYTISDGRGGVDSATVTVLVSGDGAVASTAQASPPALKDEPLPATGEALVPQAVLAMLLLTLGSLLERRATNLKKIRSLSFASLRSS